MRTRISKWGNSDAVRIPTDVLLHAGFQRGEGVRLLSTDCGILIARDRPRPTLDELLSNTPTDARVVGWDENGTAGKEML